MMEELFNSKLFLWSMGLLSGTILILIRQCLTPQPLDDKVVRYRDVKKLLAEKEKEEKEKFAFIVDSARTQIDLQINAGINQLILENGALITQFTADQQGHVAALEGTMKEHSERLDFGGRILEDVVEKVEKLSDAVLELLPPACGKTMMKLKGENIG